MAQNNPRLTRAGHLIVVNRLKLAAWLYVNDQRLVDRRLDALGQHILYYFEDTEQFESLVQQWFEKKGLVDLHTLANFSVAVSFEIRVAARMRRGEDASRLHLPRRLRSNQSDNALSLES